MRSTPNHSLKLRALNPLVQRPTPLSAWHHCLHEIIGNVSQKSVTADPALLTENRTLLETQKNRV